jgi:coiled-coil domain-containing protein 12
MLREKAGKASSSESTEKSEEQTKRLKFRNYQPRDQSLVESSKENVEEEVGGGVENSDNLLKKELRMHESEELNILPKSSNWDIKKTFEPKLEKLRRRTQRAIVDFLREKLNSATDSEEDSDEEVS